MVVRETLADGAVRLSSSGCSFLYQRLKPGRLILRIQGKDSGQFGAVTREEIEAELAHSREVELYVDAAQVAGVAPEVADAWIAWLLEHRGAISSCTLLGPEKSPEVAVAFGRLAAKFGDRAQVLWGRAEFERAAGIERAAPAVPPVSRETLPDGAVRLRSPGCTFLYQRVGRSGLLVTISGTDKGEFGSASLDEIDRELRRVHTLNLFVDTRGVSGAATTVSDAWAEWFQANRAGLAEVRILVSSKIMRLTISVAQLFSRTGELMRIETDEDAFLQAIRRLAPQFQALPRKD